ncbi:MAG: hypothetical protein II956_08475 [Bacteroidales bacterium]|nr:hypothetical protein [Bacteroidales bacterium]
MINSLSKVSNIIIDETVGVVKKTFDNLVSDNKISEGQGKSIFENIKNGLFDKSSELENSVTELIKKIYAKMDIATPEELEGLKRRVTLLEKLTK